MSELDTLARLSIDAKDAAKRMYAASESLDKYIFKNNKCLGRILPDLKKIGKGLETTTKVASDVQKALPDLRKLAKTAETTAKTAKEVGINAKKIAEKAKQVTDLFGKTLGKKVPGGIGAGANMLASLATAGITVLAVKTSEELLDIKIRELDRESAELSKLFSLGEKNYRYTQRVERRVDALSADYDVLASYQGDLTQRLNKNEHDFLFLKQEINQQLNALNEVIRISNVNTYNNDLKLQNQILELAEKIKNIKLGTNNNNSILDLVNTRLSIINELIAKNENLNQVETDRIKKEIKSLNDKIRANNQSNNNNQGIGSNTFNPEELWKAINTNKNHTATALNKSNLVLNQLKTLSLSDSKQEKRLQFLEKDLPKKFEARRQFEVQTEKEFKEQTQINKNQSKEIRGIKADNSNIKTDVSKVQDDIQLVATSVKIVDGKIENIKYTKLDKADYDNGIKIVDGKIEPLKNTTQKNEFDLNTLAGGFTALGSGMVKLQQDLNNLKNKPIKLSPQNFPDLDLLKKDIENFKKENDNFKKETEKVNKEGNDLIKNILPTLLPILHLIPAKTADGLKPSIPTIPQIENAAATGTCKTFQPGGCSITNLNNFAADIKKNQDNANKGLWDKINTGLNGLNLGANTAQLTLLNTINGKLGPAMTGGISTFLTNFLTRFDNFAKWLKIDRVLNVLIWVNTLHNAYQLSSNLGQTLFSGLDNILNFFFQDAEGEAFDSKTIIGNTIDGWAKTILGVETWEGIKNTWKKYNRIYQASANLLNNITSMFSSVYNIFDVIGNRVSRIGNALKWFGLISDKFYGYMNENNNFGNPIIDKLTNLNEAADSIEMVSGDILNVKVQGNELKKNKKELDEAIKSLEKKEDDKDKTEKAKNKEPEIKESEI